MPTHSHYCPWCQRTWECDCPECAHADRAVCLHCEDLVDEGREIQRQVEMDRQFDTGEVD